MKIIKKTIKNIKEKGFKQTFKIIFLHIFYKVKKINEFIKKQISNIRYKNLKRKTCDGLIIKKIHNNKMLLDVNDMGISKELALTGWHEKNSSKFIKKELKPGMHIVEIGANIGYYTLIEAGIIGENGHIYAFEPNPKNMSDFKINIALNNYNDLIEFFPFAIGSENTEADFYMADFGNLSTFAKRDDNLCDYKVKKIKVVKLDDLLKDKKIDYFRMDVEGYETEVIKGMHNILSSPEAPYGMFIEVHSELLHKLNSSAKEFLTNLSKYGYDVKKSFYRGKEDISVENMQDLLNHNLLEKGYWETFFYKK
jgi:FkbM family methyltransferase